MLQRESRPEGKTALVVLLQATHRSVIGSACCFDMACCEEFICQGCLRPPEQRRISQPMSTSQEPFGGRHTAVILSPVGRESHRSAQGQSCHHRSYWIANFLGYLKGEPGRLAGLCEEIRGRKLDWKVYSLSRYPEILTGGRREHELERI
jgi:hypothetical protein